MRGMFRLVLWMVLMLLGVVGTAGSGGGAGGGSGVGDGDSDGPGNDNAGDGDQGGDGDDGQGDGGGRTVDLANLSDDEIAKIGDPGLRKLAADLKADYTRKTQDLGRRAAGLDWAEEVMRTHEEQGPEAAAELLEEMVAELGGGASRSGRGRTRGGESRGEALDPMEQRALEITGLTLGQVQGIANEGTENERLLLNSQLRTAMSQARQEARQEQTGLVAEQARAEATLAELWSEYKDMGVDRETFERTVLSTATRRNSPNLADAARLAFYAKVVDRDATRKLQARQRKAALSEPDLTATGEPTTKVRSMNEAAARARARLAGR